MTKPTVAIETVEQASRWLGILLEAHQQGHWDQFAAKHRAFLGFCRVLASDAGAVAMLSELLRAPDFASRLQEALDAVDQATSGMPGTVPSHVVLFSPPLDDIEARAIHLDAYVRQVPLSQDGLYRESGVIIDHSLKLRDQLKDLLIASTDFDSPGAEAFCVYLFGTLLANTPPNLYAPLLGNSNHVPFYFQLLIDSCEAVLNAIRARQAKNPSAATRLKSEKFGILDSPQLLSQDLASASGVLGMACVYLDIDNFKALNTRHSERVVDRDILTPFQRLLSSAVQNIGFAYAEGGDEVTILLPNATAEMAAAWCAGLRSILANRVFPTDGAQVQLSASAGISHTEQGGDRSVLPQQANLAMRKAKELGKDRVCASTADGIQGLSLPKART